MGKADEIYNEIAQDILDNGAWDKGQEVRTKWADGTPAYTKSLLSVQMRFDNTETPIITSKRVAWKTSIKEILTFWQEHEYREEAFHKKNVRIWDEWIIKAKGKWRNTIGPSYGYQLGVKVRKVKVTEELLDLIESGFLSGNHKFNLFKTYVYLNQVDYLLYQLKVNPYSRRNLTTLWNIYDLDEMALNPCVWTSQWIYKNNKLNLVVGVRSNDWCLGNAFNVFQYYVLQRMFCQVLGYEIGELVFNINDAHVYERHIETLEEQLKSETFKAPTLRLNPDVKSFYDFTIQDFDLSNYQTGEGSFKYEVAI